MHTSLIEALLNKHFIWQADKKHIRICSSVHASGKMFSIRIRIMPRMEKEDRDIVTAVINDITDFSEVITQVMEQLKSSVSEMNDIWDDAQYTQFFSYVDELERSVKRDIDELGEAKADLANRLAQYD